jgi:hypothetical protein
MPANHSPYHSLYILEKLVGAMLIQVLNNEAIRPYDKLLHVFAVGFATKDQLSKILKWNINKVNYQIKQIRKKYESNQKTWLENFELTSKNLDGKGDKYSRGK